MMSWRDRTAEILGNAAGCELTKPTKAPAEAEIPLLSVLSVTPPPLSDDFAAAAVNATATREGWSDQARAEALEDAWGAAQAAVHADGPQVLARGYGDPVATAIGNPPRISTAQMALDCRGCWNLNLELLADDAGRNAGQRFFQWTCTAGHSVLRLGYRGEDVLAASEDCNSYMDKHKRGLH